MSLPCLSVSVACITIDLADWRLGQVREIKVKSMAKAARAFRLLRRGGGSFPAASCPAPPRALRRSQAASAGEAQRFALVEQREQFLAKRRYLCLCEAGRGTSICPYSLGGRAYFPTVSYGRKGGCEERVPSRHGHGAACHAGPLQGLVAS